MATSINDVVVLQSTMILMLACIVTPVTANFNIVPSNITQAKGLNAVFLCRHDSSRFYDWEINGISEDNGSPPNVTASSIDSNDGGSRIRTLTIVATEQYNESVIVCVVPSGNSPEAILTVQGRLDSVTNIRINSPSSLMTGDIVSVSWGAPFTLDITDTDPDITYCVDLYSTIDRSHVFSECGIINTQYNVSLDNVSGRTCDNFNITVIPVNGAGNGSIAGGIFETLGEFSINDQVHLTTPECETSADYQVVFQVSIEGSVSTCDCQVEIDGRTFNSSDGLNCAASTLRLTTKSSQLPLANFYDLTVTLSNSVGSINASMEIDTNIIESVQVNTSSNNTVELSASFSSDTCLNSTDVFVILTPLSNSSISITLHSVYSILRGVGTEPSIIDAVSSGQYALLVYDIGSNGLLRSSPVSPITRETITVSGDTLDASNTTMDSILLDVQRHSDTLNITCTPQQNSMHEGCFIILQFIGTIEEFERLNVYTLSEGNQMVVHLNREGRYVITGYPTTNRGIVNSRLSHAETISVEFIFPTAIPTMSTSMVTDGGMESTSTDTSGTPTSGSKYDPNRNIIIGVVVAVAMVAIIVVVVIIIVVTCGKKKYETRKSDIGTHRRNSGRNLLFNSRSQSDNGVEASIEMRSAVADGEDDVETKPDGENNVQTDGTPAAISQAPPNYNDVVDIIDPMYESVPSSKSKAAPKPNGVTPDSIPTYDPQYDSVGPATNNRTITVHVPLDATAIEAIRQEDNVGEPESNHREPPKLDLSRTDEDHVSPEASNHDHPSSESEAIAHTQGPVTGEPYAVVDKTKKEAQVLPEASDRDHPSVDSDSEGIQHTQGPFTGEPYAVVDKSKKSSTPKTESKPIQHVEAPTGDMYALVDKPPKRPSSGKRPPPPPPPTMEKNSSVDRPHPPLLERQDVPVHHEADVFIDSTWFQEHVYDSLVSPDGKPKKISVKKSESSTHPYESVSLEQRKHSNQLEYKDIVTSEDTSLSLTGELPGQVNHMHSQLSNEENDNVDSFNAAALSEQSSPSKQDSTMDSNLSPTRSLVADSSGSTSLTSSFSPNTQHSSDHSTDAGRLHHPIPANLDYTGGKTEEDGQFLYTVV